MKQLPACPVCGASGAEGLFLSDDPEHPHDVACWSCSESTTLEALEELRQRKAGDLS